MNLMNSWEVLKLATNIYCKMLSTTATSPTSQGENIRNLCDTLLFLCEVSIQNKNYTEAVEDLFFCPEKHMDKQPEEKRRIAEAQ